MRHDLTTPERRKRIALRCIQGWARGESNDTSVWHLFTEIPKLRRLLCCLNAEDKADMLELLKEVILDDNQQTLQWMTKIKLIHKPELLT